MKPPQPTLYVDLNGRDFLLPYLHRAMNWNILVDSPDEADHITIIVEPGEAVDSGLAAKATILECPNIVGTGMSGLPMKIASKILKGTYFHVKDSEARLSTVHAVDVAAAIDRSAGTLGRFLLTDGTNPTFYDFAEALAYRLDHKRVFTLKSRYAKWLLGGEFFKTVTESKPAEGEDFNSRFHFEPHSVVEYLKTHVYDDESL